jgi:hypothetical protein
VRAILGSSAAVAALLAAGPLAPGAQGASHPCGLAGSKTVRQIGRVRIYRFHQRVYGCSARYGRRVLLTKGTDRLGCFSDRYTESANTVVALAHDASPDYAQLSSWNLRSGSRLRKYTYTYADPGCGSVYRLVTNSAGSLAWIALSTEHENGEIDVGKDDSRGFAELDFEAPAGLCDPATENCGDSIDTSYLAASGGMVFWKANGALKGAPFA